MSSEKANEHADKTTPSSFELMSRIFQTVILGVIVLMLLLSPVLIYWFTARFESKLPMCSNEQPASDTWRCKVDEGGKTVIMGGNPEYCLDGKQHFVNRAWCNFNWDRPIQPVQ
ncbi:hypothetical protein GCM10008066_13370 [Oxalicibacterium faecigallinarum]|uniref:Uncharacterized protein n=2 Tax=Oxalicibacterium faecigallinarum TaxID=573741 RepID=A0A8J3AX91_9BURK|nr:hypothetical protein GCM10008066_13370 [Oxalicibacterium faecigallinarum]